MNITKKNFSIALMCLFFLSTLSFHRNTQAQPSALEVVVGVPLTACGIFLQSLLCYMHKRKKSLPEPGAQMESNELKESQPYECTYLQNYCLGTVIVTGITGVGLFFTLHGTIMPFDSSQ